MDTNNNFYNLLFSDPNVSSDYKDALAAGFIPPYKKPDPAADPPQSDVSPLDPGNQLIMYADIAKNWFNEFKEKFPAQYEFLFDNMIQPFPIEKLTDAVAAAVDQRIAQNKTAHLWCHAKDKEQLMDALMHIRDCFWSDGESDAERIAYLQEYVKIRLSEFEDNPNAKK